MRDPRYDKLAKVIVGHSTNLKKGRPFYHQGFAGFKPGKFEIGDRLHNINLFTKAKQSPGTLRDCRNRIKDVIR